MMQRQAYILVAPSGSGKSTVVQKIINHPEYHDYDRRVFSMDDVRCYLFIRQPDVAIPKGPAPLYAAAFEWCAEHREEFDAECTRQWYHLLDVAEVDVIVCDNTHLNPGYREKWIKELRERGFFINVVRINTPKEVVIERQKTRIDKRVPVEVIEAQYAKLEEPLEHEFDRLIVIDGTKEYTDEQWQRFLSHN